MAGDGRSHREIASRLMAEKVSRAHHVRVDRYGKRARWTPVPPVGRTVRQPLRLDGEARAGIASGVNEAIAYLNSAEHQQSLDDLQRWFRKQQRRSKRVSPHRARMSSSRARIGAPRANARERRARPCGGQGARRRSGSRGSPSSSGEPGEPGRPRSTSSSGGPL